MTFVANQERVVQEKTALTATRATVIGGTHSTKSPPLAQTKVYAQVRDWCSSYA